MRNPLRKAKGPGIGERPCEQCPWLLANHGKRHPHGFFRKTNLRRLWNQIRRGGGIQTCHMTDPSHPDHGAPEKAELRECAGSVVLVMREMRRAGEAGTITPESLDRYKAEVKAGRKGLTDTGLQYWVLGRYAGQGWMGLAPMPDVSRELMDDAAIGRPET